MAPLAPETPVSPVAQAPPDRPTMDLEQALNNVRAIIFRDRVMDKSEMALFRDFLEELATTASTQGAIGMGGRRPPGAPTDGAPPQSPAEMNMNTQDMGTVEGATPLEQETY